MDHIEIVMKLRKRVALVADDNKKQELLEWAGRNKALLALHEVYATGTTGKLFEKELGFEISKLRNGPLGGDMQIGTLISWG